MTEEKTPLVYPGEYLDDTQAAAVMLRNWKHGDRVVFRINSLFRTAGDHVCYNAFEEKTGIRGILRMYRVSPDKYSPIEDTDGERSARIPAETGRPGRSPEQETAGTFWREEHQQLAHIIPYICGLLVCRNGKLYIVFAVLYNVERPQKILREWWKRRSS